MQTGFNKLRTLSVGILALVLCSCATLQPQTGTSQMPNMTPSGLQVVGYAATPNTPGLTEGEKQVLAQQASRQDAYRQLSDLIYGLNLRYHSAQSSDQTALTELNIDSVQRLPGIRIVAVEKLDDGIYKTTVELSGYNPKMQYQTENTACNGTCNTSKGLYSIE